MGLLCFYYRRAPGDAWKLWFDAYGDPWDVTNDGRENPAHPGSSLRHEDEDAGDWRRHDALQLQGVAGHRSEPSEWALSPRWPARAGSVIVVEDYADVSVGPVTVTPIGG